MKQVALRVVSLVLGLAVALGFSEVIARWEGSYSRYLAAMERRRAEPEERKVTLDLPAQKVIRIACIGDSFSFGKGFSASDTWPERLERLLNDAYSGTTDLRFDLVNYSMPGADINSHRGQLDHAWRGSPYAFVIQQLLINDITTGGYLRASGLDAYTGAPRRPRHEVLRLTFHSAFYLDKLWNEFPLYVNSYLDWHDQFQDGSLALWPMLAQDFQSVVAVAHARDAEMFTFLVPIQIWRNGEYRWSGVHDQIDAVLRPHADHFVDLTDFLMSQLDSGYDHWILPDLPDGHPDAETHRVYAEGLFAELERREIPRKLISEADGRWRASELPPQRLRRGSKRLVQPRDRRRAIPR